MYQMNNSPAETVSVPTNTFSVFSLAHCSGAAHNCSGHEVVLKAQNDVDQNSVHTTVTGTTSNQSIMLTSRRQGCAVADEKVKGP